MARDFSANGSRRLSRRRGGEFRCRPRWVVGKIGGWEIAAPLRRLAFEGGGEADVAGREEVDAAEGGAVGVPAAGVGEVGVEEVVHVELHAHAVARFEGVAGEAMRLAPVGENVGLAGGRGPDGLGVPTESAAEKRALQGAGGESVARSEIGLTRADADGVASAVFEEIGDFFFDGAAGGDAVFVVIGAPEGDPVGEAGLAFGEVVFAAAVCVGVGEASGPLLGDTRDELGFVVAIGGIDGEGGELSFCALGIGSGAVDEAAALEVIESADHGLASRSDRRWRRWA